MLKNLGKTSPEAPSDANLAPRASWEPLGLDFGAILEPFCCRALVLRARFGVLQYLAQGPSEAWTQPTQELRSVPLRRQVGVASVR